MYNEDIEHDHTIILFDWDDTFHPSAYITSKKKDVMLYDNKTDPYNLLLDDLSKSVISLIETIKEKTPKYHTYDMYIVTNADNGWVELSSKTFMPKLHEYIINNNIPIISAKSQYCTGINTVPYMWKYFAFYDIIFKKFGNINYIIQKINIISIGDSNAERIAVNKLKDILPSCSCKSIKMAELPDVEVLQNQLELLKQCWIYLFSHPSHLDLQLEITKDLNTDTNKGITASA
jgi:hypothetical protein